MDKELERLEELKKNSIENPGKKKRGCSSCKKSKDVVVEKAPLPFELEIYIPTPQEIKLAYEELGSIKLTDEKKIFINKIYFSLFDEQFDFNCRSCVSKQARKLYNYITYELNMKL